VKTVSLSGTKHKWRCKYFRGYRASWPHANRLWQSAPSKRANEGLFCEARQRRDNPVGRRRRPKYIKGYSGDLASLEGSALRTVRAFIPMEASQPLVNTYLFMFFLASFKATSGVALPLVAISNAAFIELQNLPIWGMLGMTTPFRAFS
jgi:hypothetical protein